MENTGNKAATLTVSEKIMSVCRKAIQWTCVFDLVLALSVMIFLGVLEFNIGPQQQIGFFCNDPKISFKFMGDTVSMGLLIGCSIGLPIVVMAIVEYVSHTAESYENCGNSSTRTRQIWSWYGHYGIGLSVLTLVCGIMKVLIGEPRPHFLDTCKPHEAVNCTDEYFQFYTCTNTEHTEWFVKDSSKSFPSGHSALSVYTSIFIVWYLQNRLPNRTLLLKPWLQCLASMWAVTCSLTRVSDHRHHWWDVLAGILFGIMFGLFVVVVSCRHFRLKYAASVTATGHAFNESVENGQIVNCDKRKHSVRKLFNSAVINTSEDREMRDIANTWKE